LKRWNSTACECQCKPANVKVCDANLFNPFNWDTCTCDCKAKPPAAGCPPGWSWSKEVCECTLCTHCVNPNA
jgi:hypothetical protein